VHPPGNAGRSVMTHRRIAPALLALLMTTGPVVAQDAIERLTQQAPGNEPRHHAHSDFTDPLGRFLDYLAAGAFVDARAIQPAACAAWRTSPQSAAFTGHIKVWDTDLDLDTLCGRH
jgi:hypothetical protein